MKLRNNKETCPHCGSDLQGDPIPEDQQELFGATHFSLKMGIYDRDLDRTVAWHCPFCTKRWPRELK